MFYTNVSVAGNSILFRGVKNGKRVRERIKFSPSLFINGKPDSKYKSHTGQPKERINFENISDAREFVDKYKGVPNFPIYGNQNWEYCFIGQNFPGDIAWDVSKIRVANIDIEVGSENGFATPDNPTEPITAITMQIDGKVYAFGCGRFKPPEGVMKGGYYIQCSNERELIKEFLAVWTADYPDAITGWYIKFFDIPYLINRITMVLGEDEAKRMSPWNFFYKRDTVLMGKEQHSYIISGIATFDYMELFRKFHPEGAAQESYKLDYICSEFIGEKKISYEVYESLHRLYKENFQLFMEYNIKDTELVNKLDEKFKFIELALTLAYDSKSNYDDVFQQVRMWDNIVYNYLWERNIVMPPKKHMMKTPYEGAYVKEPQLGKHEWVVSFDLTSLYPHLMMQYNISPDTIVEPTDLVEFLQDFTKQNISVETLLNQQVNTEALKRGCVTVTPNGQLFQLEFEGFMPAILTKMFADRQMYKKKMLEAEKELEEKKKGVVSVEETKRLEYLIARYKSLQTVKKICLNSCYGALGNEYFRFFDVRQAAAVTTAGQLSIRWVINNINSYMNKLLGTDGKDYIIASDTDSIYLNLGPLVNKVFKKEENTELPSTDKIITFLDKVCSTQIQPFIDNCYKDLATYVNAYGQKMIMKREKICDVGIAIGGKNYIWNIWDEEGIRFNEAKLKPVGLKMIKSNTPEVCRKLLKGLLKLIVSNKQEELQDLAADFKQKFKKMPIEEVATPTGMKGLEEYADQNTIYKKGTTIHIKASLLYNHRLKALNLEGKYPIIRSGEKVKYIYLKLPNPLQNEVIAFPTILPKEMKLHDYIDWERQFDSAFVSPLKAVLDVMGWSVEAKSSVESFFT